MKKWNDVYFYSYDENGTKKTNKIINIIEGTESDHNLTIYLIENGSTFNNNKFYSPAMTYQIAPSIQINTNDSNIIHTHYSNWHMHVNLQYFYEDGNVQTSSIKFARDSMGAHELGHILGLKDIDVYCPNSSYHHEELLMGYGETSYRQVDVTYKDIAGVAITRGFHTDNDHCWMKRINSNGTIDLICSICNGVLYNVELDSNDRTYQGKTLKDFKNCIHNDGINFDMLLVATDGERDFFKCQYCRHIDTINVDKKVINIGYGTDFNISNQVNKGEKSYIKCQFINNANYDFIISSTYPLEVKLYDKNFNEISISLLSTNSNKTKTFSKNLLAGTYYLKTNYVSNYVEGTINISIIGEEHTHSYTMQYFNYKWHALTCECGEIIGSYECHAILSSSITNGKYAICIGCNHLLDLSIDEALIGGNNTSLITQKTINGSYILPSGIIVLVDEDLEAYLNNTLNFYNENEIPIIK